MITFNIGAIGQDRRIQDPRRAQELTEGRYRDQAAQSPETARYPNTQKASDRTPFATRGSK